MSLEGLIKGVFVGLEAIVQDVPWPLLSDIRGLFALRLTLVLQPTR